MTEFSGRRMPRFELIRPAIPGGHRFNPFTRAMVEFPRVPERRDVFEVEARGQLLETFQLKHAGRPRYRQHSYATTAQAQEALKTAIANKKRGRYVEVGPSRHLAPVRVGNSSSTLLLDELFKNGDLRFVSELYDCTAEKKLATLAAPWIADVRPGMRQALLDYVLEGCDRYGHRMLVKALFKAAEKNGDDELMAHFMVAFDGLSRRFLTEARSTWTPQGWTMRKLLAADPTLPRRTNKKKPTGRFSRATRGYVARRAWRYFRGIGKADIARFARAMDVALPLYRDEHITDAVGLLDKWSLIHALYAWSPSLERQPRGVVVAAGQALATLAPAPYFPAAFRGRRDELLVMLGAARSRTVRTWIIAWLEREYAGELEGLDIARLRVLLASESSEVSAFGAKLLATARGLESVTVPEWLALLRIENLDVAPLVVTAFEKHVSPKRLDLAQCIELTGARIAQVAELGLRWAKALCASKKGPTAAEDLDAIVRVARATVAAVRTEGVTWVLALLDKTPHQRPEHLRDLFDANAADVRALAAAYVKEKPEAGTVPLWFALVESPYADVREIVLANAEKWLAQSGPGEIEYLASTVILSVHRGAATKHVMLRELAARIADKPAEAERLLPVLAFALRSVRPAERAGALAALAQSAVKNDEVRAAVARVLPDLQIATAVSA